tara:strand:- start:201 stop:374 length:174 start_codon:yes stop_codon:yes gene_type:complete
MDKEIYTKKKRLIYATISFIIGGIFSFLEWSILSYIALAFGIIIIFTIKDVSSEKER